MPCPFFNFDRFWIIANTSFSPLLLGKSFFIYSHTFNWLVTCSLSLFPLSLTCVNSECKGQVPFLKLGSSIETGFEAIATYLQKVSVHVQFWNFFFTRILYSSQSPTYAGPLICECEWSGVSEVRWVSECMCVVCVFTHSFCLRVTHYKWSKELERKKNFRCCERGEGRERKMLKLTESAHWLWLTHWVRREESLMGSRSKDALCTLGVRWAKRKGKAKLWIGK